MRHREIGGFGMYILLTGILLRLLSPCFSNHDINIHSYAMSTCHRAQPVSISVPIHNTIPLQPTVQPEGLDS